MVIFMCLNFCYGSKVEHEGLARYLDLLKESVEKEKGIVKNINWMEVGKRETSGELLEKFLKHELGNRANAWREFGDFLKYFEVLKENLEKENGSIQTYKLINIGKKDDQKEKLHQFFQYLEALKDELNIENNVKKNENQEMEQKNEKMGKGKTFPRQKFIRYLFRGRASR